MYLSGVLARGLMAAALAAAVLTAPALGIATGAAHADSGTSPSTGEYAPPPGHRAGIDGVVPMWAPPPPRPPLWAPWVPVVWNADLPAWGVWWNGAFIRL